MGDGRRIMAGGQGGMWVVLAWAGGLQVVAAGMQSGTSVAKRWELQALTAPSSARCGRRTLWCAPDTHVLHSV